MNVCVCMSVPKDLANQWTDLVLLYTLDSYKYLKGEYLYFVPSEIAHRKKYPPPLLNNPRCL